uniref:Uncharacterized protein n=1 Tax=Solanum lycopersicum TaxID=4081 RepID=A0A3Q7HCB2_SOLLC
MDLAALEYFSYVDLPPHYMDSFKSYDPVGGEHFNAFAAGLIQQTREWDDTKEWNPELDVHFKSDGYVNCSLGTLQTGKP